jgi:AhpD family alkylhydroperoxidase
MKLDDRIRALIAVGASITANCQPCLQSTLAMAVESGVETPEIAEAIEVGKMVRRGAASKMDKFAASLDPTASLEASPSAEGCGCR